MMVVEYLLFTRGDIEVQFPLTIHLALSAFIIFMLFDVIDFQLFGHGMLMKILFIIMRVSFILQGCFL